MTWSSSNKIALLPLAVFVWAVPASAQAAEPSGASGNAPLLSLPITCDMTRDCSIQKYVDRASGPERLDYRCGALTTDGHDGIDFRLRRPGDFNRDVKVVAAAAGTVLRVRDGMEDISVKDPAAPPLEGRLAGNGVVVAHGGGWETQYSHLKRGSVHIAAGDHVEADTVLGAVGMSGNAEFPHLHFEVRHNGRIVDPFAADDLEGCNKKENSLWNVQADQSLPYRSTEILSAGFATTVQKALGAYQEVKEPEVLIDPDIVLLWGISSGVQSGDVERFDIHDPRWGVILSRETRISKNNLQRVGYAGLRRPVGGWIPGQYVGTYLLIRKGKIVGEVSARQDISGSANQ